MSYWLKADKQFGDISDEAAGILRIQGSGIQMVQTLEL